MEVSDLKMLLWMTVWALVTVTNAYAQMGLRAAQLTAPKISHLEDSIFIKNNSNNGLSLFSKWTGIDLGHRRRQTGGMDSELAAIFRGVAYGVTIKPPTTPILPSTTIGTTTTTSTTTTTTTTPQPSIYYSQGTFDFESFSESPEPLLPNIQAESSPVPEVPEHPPKYHPMQYPYLEAPEVRTQFTEELEVKPTSSISDSQVVWADISDVKWVKALGIAWVVHVYTAAALYCILVLLAIFWLSRVNAKIHLLPHGYYITLHLLMFLAAFLRCVHLFHDPYGAEQRLPQPLSQAVEETAWPCLTAAVGVVAMSIVRAWQCPRLIPKRNLTSLGLALITAVHLVMALTAHLVTGLLPNQVSSLRAAARSVTVAWGGTVGLVGLIATWRVAIDAGRFPSQQHMHFNRTPTGVNIPLRNPRMALVYGTWLTLVACIAQVTLSTLHLYALIGPFHLLDVPPLYPWQWMAYQSSARTLEIITWVLLGAISALNVGGYQNKYTSSTGEARLLTVLGCHCCGSSTSVATQENIEDMYPTMCQTNHALRNLTLQSCGKGIYQDALGDPIMRRANTGFRANKRNSIRKSATSDMTFLWNNGNLPVNSSSRPSSMLFNDSGFIRFKMQGANDEIRNSLQNLDLISHDNNENTKKKQVLQQAESNIEENIYIDDPHPYKNSLMAPEIAQQLSYCSSEKLENHLQETLMENLLQNRINAQLYSGLKNISGNQDEANTMTDYSSTDNQSPIPPSDADWSKYASNCSSISATTSFDVRMYGDFEVGHYYQNPSCASSHTYASLQRPPTRGHNFVYNQHTMSKNFPEEIPVHSYESQQAAEKLTALLAPYSSTKYQLVNNDYVSVCSPDHLGYGSDSDIYSSFNGRCTQLSQDYETSSPGHQKIHNSHRVNVHDVTPDSGLAVDYSGNTDETSGDDTESTPSSTLPKSNSGLFSKIVKNNFSRNNSGYTPLDTDDPFLYQQLYQQRQTVQNQEERQHYKTSQTTGHVRPCGHRPRRGRHSDIKTRYQESPLVNTSPPTNYSCNPNLKTERNNLYLQYLPPQENIQLKIKQQHIQQQINQKRLERKEQLKLKTSLTNQSLVSPNSPLKDIATIFEVHDDAESLTEQPTLSASSSRVPSPPSSRAVSPSSTRPASSVASHSDLPSECVDSEDDSTSGDNSGVTSEDETTSQATPSQAWPPPARLIRQQTE
ncbi:unnamed protein product [Meganyctiphanes norvegica]|uniref:Proline-rich transmembrane protein 3/4 domain-containing protein n=1 Tax=Meganyctiphanes norvegica TaxID=48144 RepID=A0AAV2Q8R2_MEGNR